MRVLGIDPGLNVTGYGILDMTPGRTCLVEAGIIRSHAKNTFETRLVELFSGLDDILAEFSPDVVSVEEIYSHYNHPKTAVVMGHARGVLFCAAGKRGIPVHSYSATRIKKSLTGNGHASKEQVAHMVAALLNCPTPDVRNDVTDAIAAAYCHINTLMHGGSE